MTSKYIDLAERIWRTDNGRTSYASVGMVLEWLDDHPDQVPVRTITESELEDATREVWGYCARESDIRFLAYFGILVVLDPEPEPTNAEKLNSLYGEWADDPSPTKLALGEWLELRGVKAPGASDD